MINNIKRGGFEYYRTEEQISEYMNLSTRDKLRWLEEANRFINKVLSQKAKTIMERYRKGEI